MFVVDLEHYLDLPETAPGPAQRLAANLFAMVRAASAGDVGAPWASTLPCRRRPGRQPCSGRVVLQREEPTGPVVWFCDSCSDEGVISNWADTPLDLRRRHLAPVERTCTVVVPASVAGALRGMTHYDEDLERLVFAMRDHKEGAALTGTPGDLDELLQALAAEANHEPDRRRQRTLDAASDALERALDAAGVGG